MPGALQLWEGSSVTCVRVLLLASLRPRSAGIGTVSETALALIPSPMTNRTSHFSVFPFFNPARHAHLIRLTQPQLRCRL